MNLNEPFQHSVEERRVRLIPLCSVDFATSFWTFVYLLHIDRKNRLMREWFAFTKCNFNVAKWESQLLHFEAELYSDSYRDDHWLIEIFTFFSNLHLPPWNDICHFFLCCALEGSVPAWNLPLLRTVLQASILSPACIYLMNLKNRYGQVFGKARWLAKDLSEKQAA